MPDRFAAASHTPAPFFMLRTPLMPLEWLAGFEGDALATHVPRGAAPGTGVAAPVTTLREQFISTPLLHHALLVAAPEFLSLLTSDHAPEPTSAKRERVDAAASRYGARVAFRTTPFGLFAGYSLGTVGPETHLHVGPRESIRHHCRLDAEIVERISSMLMLDDRLLLAAPLMRNSTLHRRGTRWRFLERHTEGGADYRFFLSSIARTPIVDALLDRAATLRPATELAAYLAAQGLPLWAANQYVIAFVRAQVFVSGLVPTPLGPDSLRALRDTVHRYAPDHPWASRLELLVAEIEAINRSRPEHLDAAYARVTSMLDEAHVEHVPGRTLHVDCYRQQDAPVLSRRLAEELRDAATALAAFATPTSRQTFGASFRDAFYWRFGDRDVPLLQLFDPETGVGADLLDCLDDGALPAGSAIAALEEDAHSRYARPQSFLLREASRVAAEGGAEIVLSSDVVAELSDRRHLQLPPSFTVMASVSRVTREQSADREVAHLRCVVGGSPAALYGRFLEGDPTLRAHVGMLLDRERPSYDDPIFADVSFTQGPRTSNVNRRPLVGDFELPVIGPSQGDDSRVIQLVDLYVRYDNGRLTLWSERLGRPVIPRLASMRRVETGRDLALYMFLLSLQAQDAIEFAGPKALWGEAWTSMSWLPRVRFRNVVLARQTWLLRASDVPGLLRDGAERRLAELLVRRRIPSAVLLTNGDQEIPLHLDSAASVQTVLSTLRSASLARLQEPLTNGYQTAAFGDDGTYANEIVQSFILDRAPAHASESVPSSGARLKRSPRTKHAPGGEWLYLKLYSPAAAQDRLLVEHLGVAGRDLTDRGLIRGWFYVRYDDHAEHLRVRLHLCDAGRWATVASELVQRLSAEIASDVCHPEIGTYEPEARRYGGLEALALSEDVFHADSLLAVETLRRSVTDRSGEQRLLLNVAGIDALLDALDLPMDARVQFLQRRLDRSSPRRSRRRARDAHAIATGLYREIRGAVNSVLAGDCADADFRNALSQAHDRVAALGPSIRSAIARDQYTDFDRWLSSVLHMHCNRVFATRSAEHEYLSYATLCRHYRTRAATAHGPPPAIAATTVVVGRELLERSHSG
jgi:thiopeptide-type bacteriocin biosynthesis protein